MSAVVRGADHGAEGWPWKRAQGVDAVLQTWRSGTLWRSVALNERLPAEPADLVAFPETLHPDVGRALKKRGMKTLYRHQRDAFDAVHVGTDVVIATPTASGKSLCYNLPVLQALREDKNARALYLFPTKALARDQETALRAMMKDASLAIGAISYDGDTPGDVRRAARQRAGVILTNPDMLHTAILPHHTAWARLFANLRYVIVDELHSYRGVFGSHLANVMRRLRRVAAFHGSKPTFVFSSATIANPAEHATRICGKEVTLIDRSGAPRAARELVVYNPPVVNAELGMRASYVKSAVRITQDLVRAGVSTLVFGQSRNNVEVMLKYLRDRLARDRIDPSTVHAYRGGYLPQTRRRIEEELRQGKIQCVVATNALELGIDIGALDAVVCAGYPGSMASLWQRFGRAGRRQGRSLAVLVTSSAPIDQYVAHHPRQLIQQPVEEARIDPDNVEILIQHLKCAAFELPFASADSFGELPGDAMREALDYLSSERVVHKSGDTYHWASDQYPANRVSLRSVGWDNFVIIEVDRDETIAEMDWHSAHSMLHEQAIYQHEGGQYQVERLDYDDHKAYVRKVEPDYYTTAMKHTKVNIIESEAVSELGAQHGIERAMGDVSVIQKVVGYKKIKYHTHENVGCGEVNLPEMQMHTQSCWITFPESFVSSQPVSRVEVIDALRGLSSAMHVVAAVELMIDMRDLGTAMGSRSELDGLPSKGEGPGFDPTIFIYDSIAGGVGLTTRLYDKLDVVLTKTYRLIERCDCSAGCPSCVGPELEAPATVSRKRFVCQLLNTIGVGATH